MPTNFGSHIGPHCIKGMVYMLLVSALHVHMAFIYVISKESEEEQQEGSSDAADGHGESSTTAGKRNTAHMQYRKGTY